MGGSGLPDAMPPLAKLAARIEREANAGRHVRLKPETARKVAAALYLVADGPMPWEGLRDYGHRVVQYGPAVPASGASPIIEFQCVK
jgi:hypothetical protein